MISSSWSTLRRHAFFAFKFLGAIRKRVASWKTLLLYFYPNLGSRQRPVIATYDLLLLLFIVLLPTPSTSILTLSSSSSTAYVSFFSYSCFSCSFPFKLLRFLSFTSLPSSPRHGPCFLATPSNSLLSYFLEFTPFPSILLLELLLSITTTRCYYSNDFCFYSTATTPRLVTMSILQSSQMVTQWYFKVQILVVYIEFLYM